MAVTAGKYSIDQLGVDRQLICVINAPNGNAEYGFRSAGRSLWSDQFRSAEIHSWSSKVVYLSRRDTN